DPEGVAKWKAVVAALAKKQRRLHDLKWTEFEDLIAHLLYRFGWSTQPMGYTKDEGIDIIAIKRLKPDIDTNMLVQCKRFSEQRKVGVDLIRQLWAVKSQRSFNQAMLVTSSTFTRGAREHASLWNLELRDRDAILDWCQALQSQRRQR